MKRFLILLLCLCVLMLSACTDDGQETTGTPNGDEPELEENKDPDDPIGGEGDSDGEKLPENGESGTGDEEIGDGGTGDEGTNEENGNQDEQKPSADVELPKVPLP